MAQLIKHFNWNTDNQGWNDGSGNAPAWVAGQGETGGAFYTYCTSGGGGCSEVDLPSTGGQTIYWTGTFEDFGIPAGSTITKFIHDDGAGNTTYIRNKASASNTRYFPRLGACYIDYGFGWGSQWDNSNGFFANDTPATSWGNYEATADKTLSLGADSNNDFYISIGHSVSVRSKSLGRADIWACEFQIILEYTPPATSLQDPIQAGIIPFAR